MSHSARRHPPALLVVGPALAVAIGTLNTGCIDSAARDASSQAESCMNCHNGAGQNDYSGPGLENPHPFAPAASLRCTTCHGGNPQGETPLAAHVPPPPQIGDREQWDRDPLAYFNRLTLTGIDKFPDYEVDGVSYSALDYLQFINPSDLRVVTESRSCGLCHDPHAETVANSLLATETGILSGAMFSIGVENAVPENRGLYENTAADLAFRAVHDEAFQPDPTRIGAVRSLNEFPVFSVRGANGPLDIHDNPAYDSATLPNFLRADNTVVTDSPLANLFHEQVAFTCGDCHLGSAGANNRYGDFRTSGCAACHMPYSLSGRSGSTDPNINRTEPANPDQIDDPELPHVRRHLIISVAKTLPSGESVQGIDDYACAGCHQGSNRTVMQYWGIRLDQNQDVRNGNQYPAQPVSHQNTSGDTRLFDPVVGNNTFNGRNRNQYLLFEDYDGDDRDDTPPDVHYEAGLGCIDCHGSFDLHGGDVGDPDRKIYSRMEQAVAIRCESCHGSIDSYAATTAGIAYDGTQSQLAMDSKGNPLRHVERESDGSYYLTSRLTGDRHYVPQTRDTVVDSAVVHPFTSAPVYNAKASYAMGRADGDDATGIGPLQRNGAQNGFTHTANMDCTACHASWTNTCMGCHLEGEYAANRRNYSNITGQRIVFEERNADFVYQSPVFFQLGINSHNEITQVSPNTKTFFTWEDRNDEDSRVFAFSDRNGAGNDPAAGHPALSHNAMMAHSIRGKVTEANEGPRYCVACHLTDQALIDFGGEYEDFRSDMRDRNYAGLDFDLLANHIGKNPGNQLNSPMWVHMVAGLGSGLFLFDEHGCAVNPLDENADRAGCGGQAPSQNFNAQVQRVAFNLDRIVDENGVSTASSTHPLLIPGPVPLLRDGATDPDLAGPLGRRLIQRLTDPQTGIVLDSWLDADGILRGGASDFIRRP